MPVKCDWNSWPLSVLTWLIRHGTREITWSIKLIAFFCVCLSYIFRTRILVESSMAVYWKRFTLLPVGPINFKNLTSTWIWWPGTCFSYRCIWTIKDAVKAQKVAVEERLDGSLHISHKGQELTYREIKAWPVKEKLKMPVVYDRRYQPADHPWKRIRRASQQLPLAS